MQNSYKDIESKLKQFIDRLYILEAARGLIYWLAFNGFIFLIMSLLSVLLNLNSDVRFLFVVAYILFASSSLIYLAFVPLFRKLGILKRTALIDAARLIYKKDYEIGEKLINSIELKSLNLQDSSLIIAALNQLELDLKIFKYKDFTNYNVLRKAGYAISGVLLFIGFIFISGNFGSLKEGSKRLISYSENYRPKDYIDFNIIGDTQVIEGEDYLLSVSLNSQVEVLNAEVVVNGKNYPLTRDNFGSYKSVIRNVVNDLEIVCTSGKYSSDVFTVKVIKVPKILDFEILISPPPHTNIEQFKKAGINRVSVPENSEIGFLFHVLNTDVISIRKDSVDKRLSVKNEIASYNDIAKNGNYYVLKEQIELGNIDVNILKDQYPKIRLEVVKDSTSENKYFVFGNIQDDYGFSSLRLYLDSEFINLGFKSSALSQSFVHEVVIENDNKELYVEVRDNDLPNGYKKSKSDVISLFLDTEESIKETLNAGESSLSNDMNETLKKLDQSVLKKNEEGWKKDNELKELSEDVKKLKELNQDLKKNLENQNKSLNYNEDVKRFQEELIKRADETDKDIEELLKELEKLEKELNRPEEDREKVSLKMETVKQELERSLEYLKKLKAEKLLDDSINKLDELEEKQKELAESKEDSQEEQKELIEDLEDVIDKLKELQDIEKELGNEDSDIPKELDDAQEEMKEALDELEKKNKSKANKPQEKAKESVKKASDVLKKKQSDMQMESKAENIEDLRQLLNNVVQLSEEEESLLKELREASVGTVNYQDLMKSQAKLRDDSKIVLDSLNSLMKRIPEIENYVIKEMVAITNYFESSNDNLKNNHKDKAIGEMQYVMLASNNLALLLNQNLENLQANKKGDEQSGDKSCDKPGQSKPGQSGLKKKQGELKKEMDGLKKEMGGAKPGGEGKSDEEIMQMLAKQEKIRMQLGSQGSNESGNGQGNEELLKEINELMKENEKDLSEKNFDGEFFERQKEIESKMLESEKALKEREMDSKREANENLDTYEIRKKQALKEYLREKYNGVEGLDLDELDLSPFYKQKIE